MKKIVLLFTLISSFAFGQVQTTTGPGNFFNPLNWDCFCVPANGDTLVINHAMQLTASIYYNTGKITINSSGSLIEDGSNRDVWVDGGSLINSGVFDCYRLYISAGSFVNTGTSVYFDSLWNQASITNSGTITVYDILNDQAASFNNSGSFVIDNNFNNQGYYLNTGTISVGNSFSNCNIQTLNALFENNGIFCIDQDFTNCLSDTLTGTGVYFVGDQSSNFGAFQGDFTFNTPTGTLGVVGDVDPAVTFGNAPCNLSIEENHIQISIFPNPATDQLFFSTPQFSYEIFDLTGKLILAGTEQNSTIDIRSLTSGIYSIRLTHTNENSTTQKFVKK